MKLFLRCLRIPVVFIPKRGVARGAGTRDEWDMAEMKHVAGAPARRLAIGLVSGLLASVAIPGFALAQQPASTAASARISFDIPAQDLNRGVLKFAQRAGIQVFYDTAKLGGRRSSAVSGTVVMPAEVSRSRL